MKGQDQVQETKSKKTRRSREEAMKREGKREASERQKKKNREAQCRKSVMPIEKKRVQNHPKPVLPKQSIEY